MLCKDLSHKIHHISSEIPINIDQCLNLYDRINTSIDLSFHTCHLDLSLLFPNISKCANIIHKIQNK